MALKQKDKGRDMDILDERIRVFQWQVCISFSKQINRLNTGRNKSMGLSISQSSAVSEMRQKSKSKLTSVTNYTKGSLTSCLQSANKQNNIKSLSTFYYKQHPVNSNSYPPQQKNDHLATDEQMGNQCEDGAANIRKLKAIKRQLLLSQKMINNEQLQEGLAQLKALTQQLPSFFINTKMRTGEQKQIGNIRAKKEDQQRFDESFNESSIKSVKQDTHLRNILLSNKFSQMDGYLHEEANRIERRSIKTLQVRERHKQ